MGNSVSRPSCLGEKSRRSEELLREPQLRDPGLDAGQPPGGSMAEAWPGPPEKLPAPVENGWSGVAGAVRSRPGSPVLKRSQSEVAVQNGSAACVPLKGPGQAGGAAWTPPRAGGPRSAWPWKPVTTREVTEVTEVTETIVTEIVEVTEYPAGEKGGEPLVTRTVTVLTERAGELAAGGRSGHADAAEVTAGQGPRGRACRAGPAGAALPAPVVCTSEPRPLPPPAGARTAPGAPATLQRRQRGLCRGQRHPQPSASGQRWAPSRVPGEGATPPPLSTLPCGCCVPGGGPRRPGVSSPRFGEPRRQRPALRPRGGASVW